MTDIFELSHEGHLPRGLSFREYASGGLMIGALKVLTVDRPKAAEPAEPTGPTEPTEPTERTETTETTEIAVPTETAETAEPNEPIEETETIETAEPTQTAQPAQPTEAIEADETEQSQPILDVADSNSSGVDPTASDEADDLKISATPLSADHLEDSTLKSREVEVVDEGDMGDVEDIGDMGDIQRKDTIDTLDTDTEVKQERDLKVDMDFEGVQQQEQGEEYWDLDME